jgi:hypothetical protein
MSLPGQAAFDGDWIGRPVSTLGMRLAELSPEITLVAIILILFWGKRVRALIQQRTAKVQSLHGGAVLRVRAVRESAVAQWHATPLPIAIIVGLGLIAAAIYFR